MADDRLRHLKETERLAWESLARHQLLMFGHYATRWETLNRDGRFKQPYPFTFLVDLAQARVAGRAKALARIGITEGRAA